MIGVSVSTCVSAWIEAGKDHGIEIIAEAFAEGHERKVVGIQSERLFQFRPHLLARKHGEYNQVVTEFSRLRMQV